MTTATEDLPTVQELALRKHDELCTSIEDIRREIIAGFATRSVGWMKEREAEVAKLLRQESSARAALTKMGLDPRSSVER
jgi:hypothetical protein